jgi:Tetratricopeptide repeat
MKTRKRVLGQEHPDTLTSMCNLTFTWKSQGRDVEAFELLNECSLLQKQKLGVDHPDTSTSVILLDRWKIID